MPWVKGIGLAATLSGACIGASEQVQNIASTKANEINKNTFYIINLARDVSYVAFGALAFLSMGGLITIAPSGLVVYLTSGLALSIGSYFYEKIYDPEGKGKNLNPDIVIRNNLDRKAYERRTV
jgi:predicted membrane channel-forming protein YqfA (hemolysin III family)